MRPRTEQIFVKIMRNGFIPQLGICGPIPNPIKVTRAKAHSMIVAGIDVYQYFPENQYTEKLTLKNVFDEPEKEEPVKKPVEKKIAEPMKPVALTGVKKDDELLSEEIEESVEEEAETDEEVDNEAEDTTEESTETPTTNNTQPTNNNSRKKKKRR